MEEYAEDKAMLAVLSRHLLAVPALTAVVLLSFPSAASPTAASALLQSGSKQPGILKKRSAVMKIEFKRSGGLAPLTNASGVVTFTDTGAHVSSEDGKYQREMNREEADQLRAAADPSNALSGNEQLRNGFQYSVTTTTNDGKRHTRAVNSALSSQELSKLSPGAAHLLQWIEQESQKILASKASGR
jgi:hypothetical protein